MSLSSRCTMPARGTPASAGAVREQRVQQRAVGHARRPDAPPGRPACRSRSARRPRSTIVSGMRCARGAAVRRRRRRELDALAAAHRVLRFAARAVEADVAGVQPGLQAVARILREQARQRLVQAQAAERARHVPRSSARQSSRPNRRSRFPRRYNCRPMRSSVLSLARSPARCSRACGRHRTGRRNRGLVGAAPLRRSARTRMARKDWAKAIKYLEKLEARYPYGRYAQQAQLEIAYCAVEGRRARRRARRGGPLHQALPEPRQRRLRLVPEGPDQLQRPRGHADDARRHRT